MELLSPDRILTRSDMEAPRTPAALAEWVKGKMEAFGGTDELKHYARLRKGLAQPLYQEIVPLSVFATSLYAERDDVVCIPCLGGQAYDARIMDFSTVPPTETFVEITYAIDGHAESIRMEVLNATGTAPASGPVQNSGTRRRGRKVSIPLIARSMEDIVVEQADLITRALGKKCAKPYPASFVLVVGFDDFLFREPSYGARLEHLVRERAAHQQSPFRETFVMGARGSVAFQL